MKRGRSEEGCPPNKKQRKAITSDIFNDSSLSNCLCNVGNATSAAGYFNGSVTMLWDNFPRKRMFSANMKCCFSETQVHNISVTLDGDWIALLEDEQGKICIWDEIQLSLDGVSSIKPQDRRSKTNKLIYKEGVIMQWKRAKEDLKHFGNTWQLQEEKNAQEKSEKFDDWFVTPAQPINEPLSKVAHALAAGTPAALAPPREVDNSTAPQKQGNSNLRDDQRREKPSPDTKQFTISAVPVPARVDIVGSSGISKQNATVQQISANIVQAKGHSIQAAPQQPYPAPSISNKAAKKQRKRAAAAAKASAQRPVGHETVLPIASTSKPASIHQTPAQAPQVVQLGQISVPETGENTPASWLANLQNREPGYKPLNELTRDGILVSVIGFVTNVKFPSRTRSGDHTTTVRIEDPSLIESTGNEFSIVCFTKHHKEWLPHATPGDILIARDIRLQCWGGTISGVGHYNRLRWAVYSIGQGCILRPELGDAPESQALADGGCDFSPFWKPLDVEIRYCERLSAWFKERSKDSIGQAGQVYGLNDDTPRRATRRHLLLCDAAPHVEPQGYFDCTVEVLRVTPNENGVYTMHVTDYTKNPLIDCCRASWCPTGLNEFIVKFELWDGAASMASSLEIGSHYEIRNARMVTSHGGHVEGKIVEKKIAKLGPEHYSEPLQALLERKREWEKRKEHQKPTFEHKLIKDAQDNQLFSCAVQLLHIEQASDEVYFHVTDYTAHPKLSAYSYGKEWSNGLEGRIVSILLRDAQPQCAQRFAVKSYLNIKNLRLRNSVSKYKFQGELGGQDVLISPLVEHKRKSDRNLDELLKRKAQWENEKGQQEVSRSPSKRQSIIRSPLQTPESIHRPSRTIKEVESLKEGMHKLRVIARAIDYYPLHLYQCIRAWCSQCKQDIPEEKQACYSCMDMEHEFVRYRFGMSLRVEDRNQDQMELLVTDECDLLQSLERGDHRRNPNILLGFTRQLQPLLGNIPDVHENLARGQVLQPDTSFCSLIVGRYWRDECNPVHVLLNVEK